jgi:hypothetical protein
VVRKRLVRTNTYYRRNDMILKLLQMYSGENFDRRAPRRLGPRLPQDVDRQARTNSSWSRPASTARRTAMDEMNIQNPDKEFDRWLEESRRILEMNLEFRAQSTRGGARERAYAPDLEVPE